MWLGINKRRFPRVSCQCLITIGKKSSERAFLTRTENIGVGGICVVLDKNLGIFSEIELELALKDNNSSIKCRGNVAWVVKSQILKDGTPLTNFDTGIEFVNISEADRQRIEKTVDDIIQIDSKK